MANPNSPLSLVPPDTTYQKYIYCAKTNTFHRSCAAILEPYSINPIASATTSTPADVARIIYAGAQEGVPVGI